MGLAAALATSAPWHGVVGSGRRAALLRKGAQGLAPFVDLGHAGPGT